MSDTLKIMWASLTGIATESNSYKKVDEPIPVDDPDTDEEDDLDTDKEVIEPNPDEEDDEIESVEQIGKYTVTEKINKLDLVEKVKSNPVEKVEEIIVSKQPNFSLKNATPTEKGDKELALKAVRINGSELKYVSELLKNDREVVLAAIKTNDYALEYASELLRNDKDIVIAAIGQYGYGLHFLSEELLQDETIIELALSRNSSALHVSTGTTYFDKMNKTYELHKNLCKAHAKKHNCKIYEVMERKRLTETEEVEERKRKVIELVKKTGDIFMLHMINDGKFTGKELKEIFPDMCLRKRMPENMICRGFKYVLGENVDTNKFDTTSTCSAGGLYFSNEKHIDEFKDYGEDMYEVELLDDSQVYIECGVKAKADKFNLVKKI